MRLNAKQKIPFKGMMRSMMMLVATVFILSSCNNDDGDSLPENVAYVSLYQASPNAPAMDIGIDNRQLNIYPFDYTDYTGYLRFYTGSRYFEFTPANANNVVADTTWTLSAGRTYSIFTVGNYNDLKVLKLEDNSDAPSDGKAKVRLVNLSPDAPTLEVKADGQTDPLFSGSNFMDASDFTELTAAEYDLMVTSPDDNGIQLNVPDIKFQNGYYYTIILRGYHVPPAGNNNALSVEIIVN
ncbi:DUF4397 domain-containing protein [Roseivirga echinicomitans]|uniref:DUF4397 domain-containing protein n=1 Tax=Roseivirga echinicomitans TaxID=296218 RepID=A0A150X9P3_9BACT|nr:DUF4397 domain-containing protein [Roseivirga echinicomitans]KYG75438.1 hypothetical protein AWN68_07790 [Roseivirga echinicomitans]